MSEDPIGRVSGDTVTWAHAGVADMSVGAATAKTAPIIRNRRMARSAPYFMVHRCGRRRHQETAAPVRGLSPSPNELPGPPSDSVGESEEAQLSGAGHQSGVALTSSPQSHRAMSTDAQPLPAKRARLWPKIHLERQTARMWRVKSTLGPNHPIC
jgi:hypothetical protein